MAVTKDRVIASCSFCLKTNNDVARLVAGPGVYICDECVELCGQIIRDATDASDTAPRPAPWELEMDLDQVLANLPLIATAGAQVEDNLSRWVRKARGLGATWAAIGSSSRNDAPVGMGAILWRGIVNHPALTRAIGCLVAGVLALSGLSACWRPWRGSADGPLCRPIDNGHGLAVTAASQLDPRLLSVTVTTAALPGPANIRILLPTGYAADPTRRYPVLYLFDGTSGHASDWTTFGEAEETTAGLPVIVVMPDITLNGNGGGWCTNWVNDGKGGLPQWETFHIDQLIPWVDQNFRTVASRSGRAIAGLSQGGFCSMSYAAQFPDMFITALAFSGAPDIAYDTVAQVGATAIINATEVGFDGVAPDSMFGNPLTDQINWAAHDPATLADNLRGLNLMMYNGNGLPGPLDSTPNAEASLIEGAVNFDNQFFHNRLVALGIPSYWDDYGPGTHSWPYWTRDLKESIGAVMTDFAHPPPAPSEVTYTSAEPQYSSFGWQVGLDRRAEEFSTLKNADAHGFTLTGSGSAVVVTAPLFVPGGHYTVTLRGASISQTATATANNQGRLTIIVPLGPSNEYQEYTAAALVAGTKIYSTAVGIGAGRS